MREGVYEAYEVTLTSRDEIPSVEVHRRLSSQFVERRLKRASSVENHGAGIQDCAQEQVLVDPGLGILLCSLRCVWNWVQRCGQLGTCT